MKRTKVKVPSDPISYSVDGEPIILSKPLLDLLLKEPNSPDLIALYVFYYYTAKWQKTNQPKATTSYVAKGLSIGTNKVKRLKAQLVSLGLIESITVRNSRNKITGHFVKVNFIWSPEISTSLDFHPVENRPVNALSPIKKDTTPEGAGVVGMLSSKEIKRDKDTIYLTRLFHKEYFKPVSKLEVVSGSRYFADLRWIAKMLYEDKISRPRIRKAIKYIASLSPNPPKYMPRIMSANDFYHKFPALERFIAEREAEEAAKLVKPIDILEKHFTSTGVRRRWEHNCLNPAIRMLGKMSDNGDKVELAESLCKIDEWYKSKQERPSFDGIPGVGDPMHSVYVRWKDIIPTSYDLVVGYLRWLVEQDWIEQISSGHFNPRGKVFRQYFSGRQNDVGIDFLTGRSLH